MKICAVIPAAGQGSRLGLSIPKILLPLTHTETVWSVLRKKLLPLVNHIHLIVSPYAHNIINDTLKPDLDAGLVSISIQQKPIGMGDAIFCGYPFWSAAEKILVVWGDQVFVSNDTLERSIMAHKDAEKSIILPLAHVNSPYVQYIFNDQGQLTNIRQTREGDCCDPIGLADIGTFLLSVPDLLSEWNEYLKTNRLGSNTGEINFLPFLPFLSAQGWSIHKILVSDITETRGINTPSDLAFFQALFAGNL